MAGRRGDRRRSRRGRLTCTVATPCSVRTRTNWFVGRAASVTELPTSRGVLEVDLPPRPGLEGSDPVRRVRAVDRGVRQLPALRARGRGVGQEDEAVTRPGPDQAGRGRPMVDCPGSSSRGSGCGRAAVVPGLASRSHRHGRERSTRSRRAARRSGPRAHRVDAPVPRSRRARSARADHPEIAEDEQVLGPADHPFSAKPTPRRRLSLGPPRRSPLPDTSTATHR